MPYNIAMDDFAAEAFQILNTISIIVEKFNRLEKNPRTYGKDIKVYPSQIRTIVIIGHNPGINITGLAKRLEVTKASASELIAKLVENGLVKKTKDANNNKEVLLHITKQCQLILDDVDKRHEQMFRDFKAILGELQETNYELVIKFLKKVEFYLDKYIRENQ
jgi:DNA-binding MarR family transcriptional regulator